MKARPARPRATAIWLVPVIMACAPTSRLALASQDNENVAMLQAALDEFWARYDEFWERDYGVTELVGSVRCRAGNADTTGCNDAATEAFLREYAERLDVTIVATAAARPACSWSRSAPPTEMGLQLSIGVHVVDERRRDVSVGVQCNNTDWELGGFVSFLVMPFEWIDGRWQRRGEAVRVVS